jgi:hypothetical protein
MTSERHVSERQRLDLERIRDALFEAKVILTELQRDNSVDAAQRRTLETDIRQLEAELKAESLEPAMRLRNRARAFYAPPRMTA